MQVWSLGWEDALDKEMATHSSMLAWRIPRAEEPGGLQPVWSQESDMNKHACQAKCQKTNTTLSIHYTSISSVQSLSCVWLFETPWTAARQASLSITNSLNLLKLLSSVVPFSSCLQSFPASGSFPTRLFFTSGGQSIGVSASAPVLPMNIQDWFPLGWTGWISLQSKGLSRVFSNTTVQKHQFFGAQLSL